MGRKKKGEQPIIDRFLQETGDVLQVADSMRKRQWFLTINMDAECFKNFDDVVVSYGEKGSGYYHYAYILHDKDTISEKGFNEILDKCVENNDLSLFDRLCGYVELPEVATDNLPARSFKEYAYKPKHYHLLMCFENARTWSSIKNHFKGANVQSCLSVINSFRYLTHDTRKAIDQGKTKYSVDDICFSPRGMEFFNAQQGEEINFDYFDPHKIGKYVWIDGMGSYHEFLLRFGAPQVQRWMSSINTECNIMRECCIFEDSHGRRITHTGKFCYYDSEKGLQFVSDKEIEKIANRLYILSNSCSDIYSDLEFVRKLYLSEYGKNYYICVLYYRVPMNELERYIVCQCLPEYAKKFGVISGELIVESVNDVPFTFADSFKLVVNE